MRDEKDARGAMHRAPMYLGLSAAPLAASVLLGVLAGAAGYTAYYGEGGSYLSNDPAACVNCHIMRDHYDGWAKASHHAVAVCNDCHAPHDLVGKYATKVENGFWHSKAFTFQDFHDPLVIRERNSRVLQGGCLHCHGEFVSEIESPARLAGRQESQCVHCHPHVGHGPVK